MLYSWRKSFYGNLDVFCTTSFTKQDISTLILHGSRNRIYTDCRECLRGCHLLVTVNIVKNINRSDISHFIAVISRFFQLVSRIDQKRKRRKFCYND